MQYIIKKSLRAVDMLFAIRHLKNRYNIKLMCITAIILR
jgi:hypothetical protein